MSLVEMGRERRDVRFFADIKVLLQELDQTQLDDHMCPCSFLHPKISNERTRKERKGKETHLDGLEYVGFDVHCQVLSGTGRIRVDVDFLDLAAYLRISIDYPTREDALKHTPHPWQVLNERLSVPVDLK
jgi:hypothetical protein